MKDLFVTLLLAVIILVIVVGVIILIGVALQYVLQYIPCDIIVYVETGLLLGLFMLLVNIMTKRKQIQK